MDAAACPTQMSDQVVFAWRLSAVSPPLLDEAVFHCQQADGKALKGCLTWNGRTFRRTHSLEEIGERCLTIDASLREAVDQAVPLSEYAWKFRYPGEPGAPAADEARDRRNGSHGIRGCPEPPAARGAPMRVDRLMLRCIPISNAYSLAVTF
ncbi:hypothetical protein SBA6_370013 [Candidatus Sulfopaludibacter sp. SbA6]|nr:hypothetical protein SBA6_370013 [Candidatus Sulfopaludibacter sp. SbA6]